MKTRNLFPVVMAALLCIPTLGSATIIPIGDPILGNSWMQQFGVALITNSYSDGVEVDILTAGLHFELIDADNPPITPDSLFVPYSQTALFSFDRFQGPGNPGGAGVPNIYLTFDASDESIPFSIVWYQLDGTQVVWAESGSMTWTGSGWVVPEPAIIPLLIISLTCIAGLRRCWKD